ncbi:hypothetical protein L2E82_44803 [Cichorium intybus]|uniref:Uncharacterized protein n=1 Tax=Cichorium intybus TaxID=13427 RepID=A0ACB8ZRK3_CICIN|nr:hypothetical protein L2E82_44803 [Cichorium intybus]
MAIGGSIWRGRKGRSFGQITAIKILVTDKRCKPATNPVNSINNVAAIETILDVEMNYATMIGEGMIIMVKIVDSNSKTANNLCS